MLLPLVLLPCLFKLTSIFLCFGWQWFQGVTFNPMQLLKDSKTVCGFHLVQTTQNHPDLKKEAMQHLMQLYSEGKIKPVIDQVYAFEEVSFTLTNQTNLSACKLKVLCTSLNAFSLSFSLQFAVYSSRPIYVYDHCAIFVTLFQCNFYHAQINYCSFKFPVNKFSAQFGAVIKGCPHYAHVILSIIVK